MEKNQEALEKVADLVKRAKVAGADAADAIYVEAISLSIACRKGKIETLARSEGVDIGLRVFFGKKQAIVSSSDLTNDALNELVDRSIAMAKLVPEDEFCGLAPEYLLADKFPDLENYDAVEPSEKELENSAFEAEEAALDVVGVSNSEGAESSWGRSFVALATSNNFVAGRRGTSHSLSVSVLAGEGTEMERDYDYSVSVFKEDLDNAKLLGKSAGKKAVARLKPQKVETAKVPVVFDPRASNSLLSHFANAINGAAVARGTTFLKEKLGKPIFNEEIVICDDPMRPRGLRSKAFDAEGVLTEKRNLIENGVLTSWILDLRSARQLRLETTGHAVRGTSSSPSPSASNLYMEPGSISPAELIGNIENGFYVTEMIGMGVDGVTGDYSRGATGFWIEQGKLAFPVSEMTIAGNLSDMFMNLTAANDLMFRFSINAPTLRVDGLTVAGK